MLKPLRVAIAFLTIIPDSRLSVGQEDMGRSLVFFPAAGLLLGAILALIAWGALSVGMFSLPVAVILVGSSAWLTRGLHLDGVADLCDGLGGSFEPDRRLAIMKDSHIGAFGVVGLVMLLLLKTAALQALILATQDLLLLAMVPAAARFAMLVAAFKARYPRSSGTGHFVVGRMRLPALCASALFLAPLIYCSWAGLGVLLACLLPALWLRLKANQALGGVTGDVLGASIEWAEAAGWLAAASLSGGVL